MKRLLPACMVIPCMMFMAGPAAASDSFEPCCSYGEQKSSDFFNTAYLCSARRSGMVGAIVMNRYPAGTSLGYDSCEADCAEQRKF